MTKAIAIAAIAVFFRSSLPRRRVLLLHLLPLMATGTARSGATVM